MARGRMISKSLSTSEKFASVSGHLVEFCHALYPLLIPHTDDFGRLQGDPFTVKHQCYPASVRSLDDFADALLELHRVELIRWYVVGSKRFIQIENFEPHQLGGLRKRTKSRFPEIPGTSGKVPDIPAEEKRSEEKRSEEEQRHSSVATLPPVTRARVTTAIEAVRTNGVKLAIQCETVTQSMGDLLASFAEFWDHYPNKVDKQRAEKEWLKLKPSLLLTDRIVQAVDAQKATTGWLKAGGDYIPGPAVWLHNHRWEDEIRAGPVLSDRTVRLAHASKEFLES